MLRGNYTHHFSNTFVQNLGFILDTAKSLTFPLPLLAVAHQQLIYGSSRKHRDDDDTTLVKIWEKVFGVSITDASNAESYSPQQLASQITASSKAVKRVGFIGLGAMGFGMATNLLRSEFCVLGFDVYKPTLSRFLDAGGLVGNSPAEVSKGNSKFSLISQSCSKFRSSSSRLLKKRLLWGIGDKSIFLEFEAWWYFISYNLL
uniref:6-phosphogluconate dehydrogenase NADP-binding domain-containing protein n=1 Tax=Nelumbo nucifera TaxID=4432 RepID=A0A822YI38_NELNU|nr:TPA_asm: hypothetical protein HUJ06_010983 [Nelumbo nucifera]